MSCGSGRGDLSCLQSDSNASEARLRREKKRMQRDSSAQASRRAASPLQEFYLSPRLVYSSLPFHVKSTSAFSTVAEPALAMVPLLPRIPTLFSSAPARDNAGECVFPLVRALGLLARDGWACRRFTTWPRNSGTLVAPISIERSMSILADQTLTTSLSRLRCGMKIAVRRILSI